METEKSCYLCSSEASIEDVTGEHKGRVDVLCKGACPRYIITQSAIDKVVGIPNRQKEVLAHIREISKAGKSPVIRYDDMKKRFVFTSKEEEK